MLKQVAFLLLNSTMRYQKPPLTFEQQIALLKSRGLSISDDEKAANYLSNISYYRLSAYMLPLKVSGQDKFKNGVSFDDVIELYSFDRELRLLTFNVIEKLEIAFRAQMSYHHSLVGGPYWFEDRKHFRDADFWRSHLDSIDTEVRRSNEAFKEHFFEKYDDHERMPIWMTSEVISLGLLSKIYRSLTLSPEKKRIAKHFGLYNPSVLQSWMQSMTYVRNICAHHARLWNRTLTIKPTYLLKPTTLWITDQPQNDKAYYLLCCLFYMIRSVNPKTRFASHLARLLERYPKIDISSMGFPNDWMEQKFWHV